MQLDKAGRAGQGRARQARQLCAFRAGRQVRVGCKAGQGRAGMVVRKDRQAGQAGQTVMAVQVGRRGREVQGRLGRAVQGMADRSGRQE